MSNAQPTPDEIIAAYEAKKSSRRSALPFLVLALGTVTAVAGVTYVASKRGSEKGTEIASFRHDGNELTRGTWTYPDTATE